MCQIDFFKKMTLLREIKESATFPIPLPTSDIIIFFFISINKILKKGILVFISIYLVITELEYILTVSVVNLILYFEN